MYTPSISIDSVIDALVTFLTPFVPGGEIVRAQVNRVAMPPSPCVVLTELLEVDLSVPYEIYLPNDVVADIHGPSRIDVQIDFYGASAGEYCQAVRSAFRTSWAYSKFTENIRPLYTSDGVQVPLITGEQQYESRWTLTASLQYNPITTVPQQYADEAKPALISAVDI